MDKRFIAILLTVVVIIGGVFIISNHKDKTDSSNGQSSKSSTSSHTEGAGTAGVELVEYGDFQCPVCGQYYPIVEAVKEKYGDQIKFTYRNFPLDSIHVNARAAARAAEAAGVQGKFFEMYRKLYETQTSWSSLSSPISVFEGYATQIGLNLDKFKTDFMSSAVNDTINADIKEGIAKYKIEGTPTFIINGKKMDNANLGSVEAFEKQIDQAIASASPAAEVTATPAVDDSTAQ